MNAIDEIRKAWQDPGPRPDVHRQAQERLRREWPALAQAIERMVKA